MKKIFSNYSLAELCEKKAEKRISRYKQGKPLRGIKFRKYLHPFVLGFLVADKIQQREKIVVVNNKSKCRKGNPVIYACNHIGGNEIERAFLVIKKPAYLMLGNPGILYRSPIWLFMIMNGVISIETLNREDRKVGYQRAVELLTKGGSLLIFPEGAWNVTPNLPVMKTFTGTVRMAKESEREIIPMAVQQYGKILYYNIGENYSIPCDTEKSVDELNKELREKLCTLEWEIMEKCSEVLKRETLPDGYLDMYQSEIINRSAYGFTLQAAIDESFHDKTVIDSKEVFSFYDKLKVDHSNAFLLNKRFHN